MDQFNTIFVHVPRCRIIICKECGIVVVKAHIATHLDTKHAYLTVSTRAQITQVARATEELAESEDEVVYPGPASEPVPHLMIWRDGLKCTARRIDGTPCGYIRRTVQDIQLHCRND